MIEVWKLQQIKKYFTNCQPDRVLYVKQTPSFTVTKDFTIRPLGPHLYTLPFHAIEKFKPFHPFQDSNPIKKVSHGQNLFLLRNHLTKLHLMKSEEI